MVTATEKMWTDAQVIRSKQARFTVELVAYQGGFGIRKRSSTGGTYARYESEAAARAAYEAS